MNLDRLKYRYWQHTDWHDENSPLEAVYCNVVDGCDPTIAVSDFEFCTGLKDKNGNLIYEGDIIKIPDDYETYGFMSGEEREVYFRDGGFRLKPTNIKVFRGYWLEQAADLEIIGNIHGQAEQKDK